MLTPDQQHYLEERGFGTNPGDDHMARSMNRDGRPPWQFLSLRGKSSEPDIMFWVATQADQNNGLAMVVSFAEGVTDPIVAYTLAELREWKRL